MKESSIYTRPFVLLCLSHGLFAASFNMMIPELPAYLESMGGGEHKGLIIALFTITAGLSRPFSGKLTDTVGRLPVMYIGTFACVLCGLLYPVLHFVSGFLILRFFHGFSTGFKPTGTSAYVADIVPNEKLGEAMGWLGISMSLGASSFAPIGSWLTNTYSINALFYASTLLALCSIAILFQLTETLANPEKFSLKSLRINRHDIFDPLAMPAAIVMVLAYGGYGAVLTLVPDLSDQAGITNRGMFYAFFTLSSVSMRLFAGRISDRIGRVPVLKVSVWLIALAMCLFAYAKSPFTVYLASVVFGLGNGIFAPAINAWTVDLGAKERKGRALATMYIALEIAIGGGAAFSGWWYANQTANIPLVFFFMAIMSICAWAYLMYYSFKSKVDKCSI